MEARILYEDDSLLVCFKPAGLAVQSASVSQPDLESRLKYYLAGKSRERIPYLGLVHRLDQPVSGLLVFAKTKKAMAGLQKELSGNDMKKEYLALVSGEMSPGTEESLKNFLVKEGAVSRVTGEKDPKGKEALLSYRVLAVKEEKSLLKIRLQTGRFHQIRCQLSHAGMPILGDVKYKGPADQNKGIALCAFHLSFKHPGSHKVMDFAQIPGDGYFSDFAKEIEDKLELLQENDYNKL